MAIDFDPHHQHLRFMSPLGAPRAEGLVAFMSEHGRGTIVDIGCGWAALLIELLRANKDVEGVGLDLDSGHFDFAERVAVAHAVSARLKLVAGDARAHMPARVNGAICVGATQVWGQQSDTPSALDYAAALTALRALLQPGEPLVYGEGIWRSPPTAAAIKPLSGRVDEFLSLPDLISLASEHGFAVVRAQEATLDEWDEFESGYMAKFATWLAAHPPTHPDAEEVRSRMRRQQEAYFRGYRGVLGMAYLSLLAV